MANMTVKFPYRMISAKPGVYLICNSVTGNQYVGSGVNLKRRWDGHRWCLKRGKHHNPKIQAAWNKYGADAFTFNVLEIVDDVSIILEREQFWLNHFDAANDPSFYNFCAVAGSHLGRKRSDETRARMASSSRGKTHSSEAKLKMRAAKLGRKLSPEHIEKVRVTSTGRRYSRSDAWKATHRRLSPEAVREFRRLRSESWTLERLSDHFHIGWSVTQRIAAGTAYVGVGA